MSEGWDKYDPAPIEVFHSEAMDEFHAGAEYPANEVMVKNKVFGGKDVRYINGIEFNRLLARFKVKIKKEYNISSDAIPKKGGA